MTYKLSLTAANGELLCRWLIVRDGDDGDFSFPLQKFGATELIREINEEISRKEEN